MENKDDFINFIKKHFKVTEEKDGSFTLYSGDEKYRIINEGLFITSSVDGKTNNSSDCHGFVNTGRDDILPDFNQRIKKKSHIKGMFPDPKELFPSEETSPIDIDQIYPKSKKKGEGPNTEPDPDHFKGF